MHESAPVSRVRITSAPAARVGTALLALGVLSGALGAGCADAGDTATTAAGDTSPMAESTQMRSETSDCADPCACAERSSTVAAPGDARDTGGTTDPAPVALARVNRWRAMVGAAPLADDARARRAASAHARFLATMPQATCWSNPHVESTATACAAAFTGAQMTDRLTAAGYEWGRAAEVINWEADPAHAVDGWLWTVYHRQPLLDWRLGHAGFARAAPTRAGDSRPAHNVMDFGAPRASTDQLPAGTTVPTAPGVFPAPGQTGVPRGFRGDLEGPTPPAPGGARAWPAGVASGPVISVHFPTDDFRVSSHDLFASDRSRGLCEPLAHTFASRENDPNLARPGTATDVFLYADQPRPAGTEYVVRVRGTVAGAAYTRTWAFTTE